MLKKAVLKIESALNKISPAATDNTRGFPSCGNPRAFAESRPSERPRRGKTTKVESRSKTVYVGTYSGNCDEPTPRPSTRTRRPSHVPEVVVRRSSLSNSEYTFPREILEHIVKHRYVHFQMCPGMENPGNNCYMNSTIQVVLHTPALQEFFWTKFCSVHENQCSSSSCSICALFYTFKRGLRHSKAITPKEIIGQLQHLSAPFIPGRQEDSHEFLLAILDHCHTLELPLSERKLAHSKSTTLVYQLFGGFLVSAVTCEFCERSSKNYDRFLDIALETRSCIRRSLAEFTKAEILSGENAYFCEHCQQKRTAWKQFQIKMPPLYLILQLKRFSLDGQKHHNFTRFPETLDIFEFCSSARENGSLTYSLYGVICHIGSTIRSGHYVAYIKNPKTEKWYKYDDSRVTEESTETVLSQNAYLLFYEKILSHDFVRRSVKYYSQ